MSLQEVIPSLDLLISFNKVFCMILETMDRRVKLAPKAQPIFNTGGVSKFGYDAGQTRANLKKRQFRNAPGFQLPKTKMVGNKKLVMKSSGTHKAVTGRYFADQAAWMAAGAVENALLEKRSLDEGMDEYWNIADQIKSVVGMGATFINPLLGAVAGPVLEGVAQVAAEVAKSGNVEGTANLFKRGEEELFAKYVEYVKKLEAQDKTWKDGLTFDRWKEWYTSNNPDEEEEGGSCQIITEAMLDGMSIEEFMAQEGIPKETEKPPPKEPEMVRMSATAEENKAIEDAFGPGQGLFGGFAG